MAKSMMHIAPEKPELGAVRLRALVHRLGERIVLRLVSLLFQPSIRKVDHRAVPPLCLHALTHRHVQMAQGDLVRPQGRSGATGKHECKGGACHSALGGACMIRFRGRVARRRPAGDGESLTFFAFRARVQTKLYSTS